MLEWLFDATFSNVLKGVIGTGFFFIVLFSGLVILATLTYLLKKFFEWFPYIDTAHRVVVYLLTMCGVVILLIGALIGAVLPLIPGFVSLFLALLLLRRYYKNEWMERQIDHFSWNMRMNKSYLKLRKRWRESKIGKALRKNKPVVSNGGSDMVEELTSENFKEKISTGTVVVDFWAPWCGPCKMFAPTFTEVAEERKNITFAKVNTDEANEVAQEARIRGIPTLIVYKDGEEVTRKSGAMPKEQFEQFLDEHAA